MIGIEAFRAAIGNWLFKLPLTPKSKDVCCTAIGSNTFFNIYFTLILRLLFLGSVAFAINTVKANVPIWKSEVYADDKRVWKENKES